MKVLHQVNQLTIGGVESFVYRLCKYAPEETAVFTYKDGIVGEWIKDLGKEVYSQDFTKAVETFNPDIIVMHTGFKYPLEAEGIKKKYPNIIWIGVMHTNFYVDDWVDKIVCLSQSVFKQQRNKEKSIIIPAGVEPRPFIVGRITRIAPYKRFTEVLQVAQFMRDFNIKFIIVGGDANDAKGYTNYLKEVCEKNDLKNIEFVGYHDDIEKWYKEFDCFLHPVGDEAYPAVLWEALSYGIPVITTSVGGSKEIVDEVKSRGGDNAFIADNPIRMASKIMDLIDKRIYYDTRLVCLQYTRLYNELYRNSTR